MKPPDVVPDAVIESIAFSCGMSSNESNGGHPPMAEEFQRRLKELCWRGDHYSFNTNGMYVGVELDGYMHT